jgi:hypothetical protein
MAFSFSKPNKTSTFFGQVNAGRKQTAGQQIPQVQGAIGTVQNQTQAQKDASGKVNQAGNQMVASTDTSKFGSGMGKLDNLGNTKVGNVPTFNTSVIAPQLKVVGGDAQGGEITKNAQITDASGRVVTDKANLISSAEQENASGQAAIDAAIKASSDAAAAFASGIPGATTAATDALSTNYQAQQAQKEAEAKRVSENNLGQLGLESADERAQAEKAALLAEKGSNAGKLAALYGVGYDVNKFGALDSNIMQGQLNEAQSNAQAALAGKEMAGREAASTRETYLNLNKGELGKINAEKTRIDGVIADKTKNVQAISEQLAKLASDTSAAGVAAKEQLTKSLTAVQKEINDTYAKRYKLQVDAMREAERQKQAARAQGVTQDIAGNVGSTLSPVGTAVTNFAKQERDRLGRMAANPVKETNKTVNDVYDKMEGLADKVEKKAPKPVQKVVALAKKPGKVAAKGAQKVAAKVEETYNKYNPFG